MSAAAAAAVAAAASSLSGPMGVAASSPARRVAGFQPPPRPSKPGSASSFPASSASAPHLPPPLPTGADTAAAADEEKGPWGVGGMPVGIVVPAVAASRRGSWGEERPSSLLSSRGGGSSSSGGLSWFGYVSVWVFCRCFLTRSGHGARARQTEIYTDPYAIKSTNRTPRSNCSTPTYSRRSSSSAAAFAPSSHQQQRPPARRPRPPSPHDVWTGVDRVAGAGADSALVAYPPVAAGLAWLGGEGGPGVQQGSLSVATFNVLGAWWGVHVLGVGVGRAVE